MLAKQQFGALVLALTLTACGVVGEVGNVVDNVDGDEANGSRASASTELAHPGRSGPVESKGIQVGDEVAEFDYDVIDGDHVAEGDILLPDSPAHLAELEPDERHASSTGVPLYRRWTAGVVPYTISTALSATMRQRVLDAMFMWSSQTPVRFVERSWMYRDYVYFQGGSGCSSYVGRRGGRQSINVSTCSTGSIAHEIGHALGLFHEQARIDRDKYVKIHWANIEVGHAHNFKTNGARGLVGLPLTTYDRKSIMHYGSYYFSKNNKATVTTLDSTIIEPNRTYLSSRDIAGISWMYR